MGKLLIANQAELFRISGGVGKPDFVWKWTCLDKILVSQQDCLLYSRLGVFKFYAKMYHPKSSSTST